MIRVISRHFHSPHAHRWSGLRALQLTGSAQSRVRPSALVLVLVAMATAMALAGCGSEDSKPAQSTVVPAESVSANANSSAATTTPVAATAVVSNQPRATLTGPTPVKSLGGSNESASSQGKLAGPSATATTAPMVGPAIPPAPDATAAPTAGPTEIPASRLRLFDGYDLDLSTGDFWRFRWEYTDRSCSQGSGCRTTEDDGVFQLMLGESKLWKGVTVYRVQTVGNTGYQDDSTTRSFVPEWDYLGVDGDRIVATDATGSSPLVTLFDAETGVWPGSGFFAGRFSDDVLVGATPGQLTTSHEFASWEGVTPGPWHSVRAADSGGECSTFDGRILCPSEEKFDYTETEHYRPGVGPFAYTFNYSATFSGGGYTTSFQTGERLALVASSLMGDEPGDFGKPTPTPPPTPAPTAIVLGDPIYGPVDGSLKLDPGSTQIPEFTSGVNIDAGIVDVTFENPDVSGKWSHGIMFRNAAEETFHMVYITSNGDWGHFARGGSLGSQVVLAAGRFDVNTTAGGRTRLTVWFGILGDKTEGVFLINSEAVSALDLSLPAALGPGDAVAVSGLFPSDEFNGATTFFTDFTVYEKP